MSTVPEAQRDLLLSSWLCSRHEWSWVRPDSTSSAEVPYSTSFVICDAYSYINSPGDAGQGMDQGHLRARRAPQSARLMPPKPLRRKSEMLFPDEFEFLRLSQRHAGWQRTSEDRLLDHRKCVVRVTRDAVSCLWTL
jgi:hypothetical protein